MRSGVKLVLRPTLVIDPLSRLQSLMLSLDLSRRFFYDFGWCEMVVSVSPLNQATKIKRVCDELAPHKQTIIICVIPVFAITQKSV